MMITRGSSTPKIIKDDAKKWARAAQKGYFNQGWMLVVRDLATEEVKPEFVTTDKDVREVVRNYHRVGAEEVLEIYDLGKPLPPQFEKPIAWEWDIGT